MERGEYTDLLKWTGGSGWWQFAGDVAGLEEM